MVVVDKEYGLDIGVFGVEFDELEALVESHHHECGGESVGVPCLAADNGDAEERVVDRAAGGGVDGVGVAHAVLLIVFAVAARCDD